MIYIYLIAIVLGGMAIHNFIVARYEFRKHRAHQSSEAYIKRWRRTERVQHMGLLLSFTLLAITGFALRFPEAWWVQLIGLGGHEILRSTLHRVFATILVVMAVYHVGWLMIARRGRYSFSEMIPRYWDATQMFQNMAYHLKLRSERPAFRKFDYTQKAEYWAVIWGTVVMALTGLILWFPTIATRWAPSWAVRVSEVVHYYEAILAVSAIFIWHFFYVIFMPSEYPMSSVWLDGKMSAEEWKKTHRGEYEALGDEVVEKPGGHIDVSQRPNNKGAEGLETEREKTR
jgi:formate dehydrogenase gamma subunit